MEIDRIPEWLERRIGVFLDLLEAQGVGAVAASVGRAGREGFEEFLHARRAAVFDMMNGASGPHEPILDRLPRTERHLMLLAVLFRLRQAYCVGKALSDRGADLSLQQHPGNLSVRAAEAGEQIVREWPSYWPRPDWPDPFEKS